MAHRKVYNNSLPPQLRKKDQTEQTGLNFDYITLKNQGPAKLKESDEQISVLQYLTTEKYKEHLSKLTNKKMHHISHDPEAKEMFELIEAGHNVCIFGVGSKIQLMASIRKRCSSYDILQIKGYLPTLNEKKVYNHFGSFLVQLGFIEKVHETTMQKQAQQYKEVLMQHGNRRVIVLFHCIDGLQFLNAESQKKFSILFDIPQVQLICTMDNMKIVITWSPVTLQKYHFAFFNINTKQSYVQEQKHRPMNNQKTENTQKSFFFIWKSLSKNQKQILRIICQNQIQNLSKDDPSHYTLNELLEACIQEIILASDSQLRNNLLQLVDHKVILEKIDQKKNKKVYIMSYERRLLQKIMELKIQ